MASGNSLQIQELPVSEPLKGIKEQHQPKQSTAMTRRGAYAALSYMACAVLLVIFNKAAISSYNFPCANVITLFQMTSSCLLLYALRYWKIISFNDVESEEESFSTNPAALVPLKTLIHTLPLALSYLLYMLASMESMRGGFISVAIIILGALVAGALDLSFDFYSYAVVFISNICTAIYLASVARVGKSSGLNTFGLMWCNGLLCGPILLCWTFISGDLEVTMNFQHLSSLGFQVVMLLSCIMAFLLNYSVFLNTTLNSALTQTICGNLKDLFTIGFGWLLFGGLPFDLLNVVGQSLGFLGSCLYAYCKLTGK